MLFYNLRDDYLIRREAASRVFSLERRGGQHARARVRCSCRQLQPSFVDLRVVHARARAPPAAAAGAASYALHPTRMRTLADYGVPMGG